jgi:hypothetical protein
MSETPFLDILQKLEQSGARKMRPEAPIPSREAPDAASLVHGASRAELIFEAAVSAVQTRLNHLSKDDIYSPPHGRFDAALARQIAVHVALRRLAVGGYEFARTFQRSRESIHRALHTVDDRMVDENFASAYADIAAARFDALRGEAQ